MISIIPTIAMSAIVGWLISHASWVDDEMLHGVSNAYASVAATMLGFVLAILAIVLSIANSTIIQNMGRTGHLNVLVKRLCKASCYFGAMTVAALAALFLENKALIVMSALATGALGTSTFYLVRSGVMLMRILTRLSTSQTGPLQ